MSCALFTTVYSGKFVCCDLEFSHISYLNISYTKGKGRNVLFCRLFYFASFYTRIAVLNLFLKRSPTDSEMIASGGQHRSRSAVYRWALDPGRGVPGIERSGHSGQGRPRTDPQRCKRGRNLLVPFFLMKGLEAVHEGEQKCSIIVISRIPVTGLPECLLMKKASVYIVKVNIRNFCLDDYFLTLRE